MCCKTSRSDLKQKRNNVFRCNFPGLDLSQDEAESVFWVLSKTPWWCTNVENFPLLIQASRENTMVAILERMDLQSCWKSYSPFDKFCCFVLVISASIHVINVPSSGKGGKQRQTAPHGLTKFMKEMKALLKKEEYWISLDDDDSAASLKEAPEVSSEDISSGETVMMRTPKGKIGNGVCD